MAAANKIEVKTVAEHKKEQYVSVIGESPELDRLAFSLPLRETSAPIDFTTGYAVMRVLERTEASREEFEKDQGHRDREPPWSRRRTSSCRPT